MTRPMRGRRRRAVRHLDAELWLALGFVGLTATGWWLHSLPLALAGALGALACSLLYLWQRQCLTGVTYRRTLSATRAEFGEEVTVDLEIVNDKLLPVTWLHIEDAVPARLEVRGGTVATDWGITPHLIHVLPVLPYQRVRRRVTVVCRERGLHRFGPATLHSGDPVGLRTRQVRMPEHHDLLVYPKRFALDPVDVVSRVLIGDARARRQLIEDPSRIAGVRDYQTGDPLRSIDWRATARVGALLVRRFEPTVSRRVALFVDFRVPTGRRRSTDTSQLEFTIAVAASMLWELAERRVPIGLFASGAVEGAPLAFASSAAPGQLPILLEALARCPATSTRPFPSVLGAERGRLHPGTSVIVVAGDYPAPTLGALAELRRRHPVTAIWVNGERGEPPPRDQVDGRLQAEHTDDWRDHDLLELAA
jgi:uncharacterized protein (DUF58 family)